MAAFSAIAGAAGSGGSPGDNVDNVLRVVDAVGTSLPVLQQGENSEKHGALPLPSESDAAPASPHAAPQRSTLERQSKQEASLESRISDDVDIEGGIEALLVLLEAAKKSKLLKKGSGANVVDEEGAALSG
jgi:hypothetical protein